MFVNGSLLLAKITDVSLALHEVSEADVSIAIC